MGELLTGAELGPARTLSRSPVMRESLGGALAVTLPLLPFDGNDPIARSRDVAGRARRVGRLAAIALAVSRDMTDSSDSSRPCRVREWAIITTLSVS